MIEIRADYDEDHDIFYINWSSMGTEYSEEYKTDDGQDIVLDYNKDDVIVGIEIFDWIKNAKMKKTKKKEDKKHPYKKSSGKTKAKSKAKTTKKKAVSKKKTSKKKSTKK